MSTIVRHGGSVLAAPPKAPAIPRDSRLAAWTIVAYAAHVPLSLLEISFPIAAAVHALAVLAMGLVWAMSARQPWRVAYAAAYIAGAELLWRMVGAPIFWEFGKYAIALLFLVATLRLGWGKTRTSSIALIYFLLLLPSALITIASGFYAVNSISFNLSGPFALMASVLFFSRAPLSLAQFRRLLLIAGAPIVGVAVIVAKGMGRAEAIASAWEAWGVEYYRASNTETSGGFSPNQVSAILGFAVLLFALYLLTGRTGAVLGAALLALLLLFGSQSAMTFSRGGLYLAASSAAVASIYLLRDGVSRRRLFLGAILVGAGALFIVIPRLVSSTGGAIVERFSSTDTTGRLEIVESDLYTWLNNPLAGVGPGQAKNARARFFRAEASHTEFTRLLAEHGLFGLAAIFCLIALTWRAITRPGPPVSKALRAAVLTWGVLFMSINGVRLAAPAFAFGLSFATLGLVPEDLRRRRPRAGAPLWIGGPPAVSMVRRGPARGPGVPPA